MDIPKFNTVPISAKKVLVAPLDWGLGHATRCIPIISALLKRGNAVIIAATGGRKTILAAAFPGIPFVDLPDYNVRLSVSPDRFHSGLFRQLPRLWSVMRSEKKWLNEFCRTQSVDLIISDNRYGLYHKDIHCIFITHQLFIFSGFGNRIDRWLMHFHFRLIARFRECWVPDHAEAAKSMAGRLSHPPKTPPFPVAYLGLLSRFAGGGLTTSNGYAKTDVLVVLSGPEPQRSQAERIIVKQLSAFNGPALLVRGLPGREADSFPTDSAFGNNRQLRIVHHLPAAELRRAILAAGTIICRSGYSTLMDLVALRRTALLLPTPGQPEQEYLAAWMIKKGWMACRQQDSFSLAEILKSNGRTAESKAGMPEPEDLFFNGELPGLTLR